MQIKYRNGGSFEHLYPKTLSENVEMNDGNNVEEWKKEVEDDLNEVGVISDKIKNGFPRLWSGSNVMDGSSVIKPSKKLSDCFTGWVLAWKQVDRLTQYQYTFIPKVHLSVMGSSTGGTKTVLSSTGGTVVIKFVYITDDEIGGHSSNTSGDNGDIELIGVYEF